MFFDRIEKLRRASIKTRERALALFTISVVAIVTFAWFVSFVIGIVTHSPDEVVAGTTTYDRLVTPIYEQITLFIQDMFR
ncbi:hypothetical protein EPO56_03725 [Patescibacteria group bacterium]|nr:MAG: hypothetical protein EPO56_03725 [Patescibacteria group bacterium]